MAWNFTRMSSALCSSRFGMQANSGILNSPIPSPSCPSVWRMSSGLSMHRYYRLSLHFNGHQILSQLRFCFRQRSSRFKMFLSVCQDAQPGFGWLRVLGPSSQHVPSSVFQLRSTLTLLSNVPNDDPGRLSSLGDLV